MHRISDSQVGPSIEETFYAYWISKGELDTRESMYILGQYFLVNWKFSYKAQ